MEIRIRNVEEWVVDAHRLRAKQNGRTLEGELRTLLTEIAREKKRAVTARMRQRLEQMRQQHGTLTDSAWGIREDRDARG